MSHDTASRRSFPVAGALTAAGALLLIGLLVWALYAGRPWLHGLLMLGHQYPLVTWMPVAVAVAVAAVLYAVAALTGTLRVEDSYYSYHRRERLAGWPAGVGVTVACFMWLVCMIFLPAWQGRALSESTRYESIAVLPPSAQPRILPKDGASEYADKHDMKHAHLVIDPKTRQLVWSAEKSPGGILRSGKSKLIAIQPLDRVDGTMIERKTGFDPAISKLGPGSLPWRAYKKHFFTRLKDRVIVPLPSGEVVALAPYVGYKGFFVKRPYLKGVYVMHSDGRLEDLTVKQALARPELVASGRIFPEDLARDLAEAYGYQRGVGNTLPWGAHEDQTQIGEPDYYGNPQPYLTSFGDGSVKWVTVGHPHGDEDRISKVFLTDADTGTTQVWTAPKNIKMLSNAGAVKLAESLPLKWTGCCDSEGYDYALRSATEPRLAFKNGKLYYLVSIVKNRWYDEGGDPVEHTVLIDAAERSIVKDFDHTKSSEADDALRAWFAE